MARCDRSPPLTTSYRLCVMQGKSGRLASLMPFAIFLELSQRLTCTLWMFEASNILLNAAGKAVCEPVNSKERRTACCMSKFSLTHFAVRLSTDSDTLEYSM